MRRRIAARCQGRDERVVRPVRPQVGSGAVHDGAEPFRAAFFATAAAQRHRQGVAVARSRFANSGLERQLPGGFRPGDACLDLGRQLEAVGVVPDPQMAQEAALLRQRQGRPDIPDRIAQVPERPEPIAARGFGPAHPGAQRAQQAQGSPVPAVRLREQGHRPPDPVHNIGRQAGCGLRFPAGAQAAARDRRNRPGVSVAQQHGDRVRRGLRHAEHQDPGIRRNVPQPSRVPRIGDEARMAGDRAGERRRRPRALIAGGEHDQPGVQRLPVGQVQPVAGGASAGGKGAGPDVPDRRAGGVAGHMAAKLLFDVAPEFAAPRVEIAVRAHCLGIDRLRTAPFGVPAGQVVRRVGIDEMDLQRRVEPVVRVVGVVGDAAAGPFARLDNHDVERPSGQSRQMDREDGAGEAAADHGDVGRRHRNPPGKPARSPGPHMRLATSSSITSVAPPPIEATLASRLIRSIGLSRM